MRLLPTLAAAGVALGAIGAGPADNSAFTFPTDAHAIIARMAQRNPALQSYRARFHVNVRMLNFPFLAPKLDGTSYYKRPGTFYVVFDRIPGYARGFQRLFDDVGNPVAWERDQNIVVDGTTWLNGRPTIVLRLTKKIHSDILDHSLAYVDQASYALMQMEWYYTSGGKITMTQQYGQQGPFSVVATQHATIDIPHVHALADASYGDYQPNVPIAPTAVHAP